MQNNMTCQYHDRDIEKDQWKELRVIYIQYATNGGYITTTCGDVATIRSVVHVDHSWLITLKVMISTSYAIPNNRS